MDWFICVRDAINFIEKKLPDIDSPEEVSDHVHMSCMYLQRGFQVLTGYTVGEYIRNRKLYLAAVELSETESQVIDIALKYGYETPASFNTAFQRFHGATPTEVKRKGAMIRSFLRLQISITVQGGENMQFRIEKKEEIRIVGFRGTFSAEDSYQKIPEFWDEMIAKYASHLMKGEAPVGETEKYVAAHHIGELGVCLDGDGNDHFDYLIAGYHEDDDFPDNMSAAVIPAGTWAVFDCTMATLQEVNTAVWKEWLPANGEYDLAGSYNVEWYSPEGEPGPNQKCELWFPVVKK